MHVSLFRPKRTFVSRWICISCRRGIKTKTDSASKALLARGPARTRFAPSPTGYLHLGSLRTALFNYLVAKATGGQFILRIEDTDLRRTRPDAEERLYEDLEWAGIQWDEGPKVGGPMGPYKQSERKDIYHRHIDQLLIGGHVYRCFCSPERLNALAEYRTSQGLPTDYDRTCAHISDEESRDRASKGEAHVVRLKAPDIYPAFEDLVHGLVRSRRSYSLKPPPLPLSSYDDPILMKSDGFPTYHLANVVDDHLMEITDVIRGSEWMSSTHKHVALYQAFGWTPPRFAHVGLLLDENRQKLSKRRIDSIDIRSWRRQGIFPETLNNFVALLGWSHNLPKDIMSMDDLVRNASMKYTRDNSVVGFEKLFYLQKRHAERYQSLPASDNPLRDLRHLATKLIVKHLEERLSNREDLPLYANLPSPQAREDYVHNVLSIDVSNYILPPQFIARNLYFFNAPTESDLRAIAMPKLVLVLPEVFQDITPKQPDHNIVLRLIDSLTEISLEDWTSTVLRERVSWFIDQGVRLSVASVEGDGSKKIEVHEQTRRAFKSAWSRLVHAYLRWALVAGSSGPDGVETMRVLGKSEVSKRLQRAARVRIDVQSFVNEEDELQEMDS